MEQCNKCKHLNKSVYLKMEDGTLYSCWCKVGNMEDLNCNKYEEIDIKQ